MVRTVKGGNASGEEVQYREIILVTDDTDIIAVPRCYLEAIFSKVQELVEKEKNGTSVQSEIDFTYRIFQVGLEA